MGRCGLRWTNIGGSGRAGFNFKVRSDEQTLALRGGWGFKVVSDGQTIMVKHGGWEFKVMSGGQTLSGTRRVGV